MTKQPSPEEIRREIESLELHPSARATQRTDALLRNLLNAPPQPHAATKPAKRARKKPRKKKK